MHGFDLLTSFSIVLLAAACHASFQLSISMLTLLSGHALGRKTAHMRLMRLVGGFILGAAIMVTLLLSTIAFVLSSLFPAQTPLLIWAACAGGGVGVGLSVWLFYFRKEAGTSLWIPRSVSRFLANRAKATSVSVEAFGLGLTSIIGELLFSLAPLCIAALVLIQLDAHWQLVGVLLYTGVALLPLLIIGLGIGSGHKLSRIQHWRETNKRFLQFVAGSGLIILAAYVYVERVFTIVVANSLGVL